jgi:hypothetical protein
MTRMSNPDPEAQEKLNSSAPGLPKNSPRANSTSCSSDAKKRPPRIVSDGHRLDSAGAARRRLGITLGEMNGVPKVTDKIIAGAGSVAAAITALRGDSSPNAQSFISKYDGLSPSDIQRVTVEEIFTAAGLSAREFIETLTGALMQQSIDVTKMILAVSQPLVTTATVKAATDSQPIMGREGEIVGYTNGDIKAQEIFHKITGMLPIPKGSQTFINVNPQPKPDDGEEDESPALESMDSFLMGLQDVLRPAPQLSAPTAPTLMPKNAPDFAYIDAEI